MADLRISDLRVAYNKSIEAIRDVSLIIPRGAIVALLGSNGAGKSTLLKTISKTLHGEGGSVIAGGVTYGDNNILSLSAEEVVRAGLIQVPEGRRLFRRMTVEENLTIGGYLRPPRELARDIRDVYDLFPKLWERRNSVTGFLSGGEQQMVAVGRALVARPKILLLDEPSLGLAPQIIENIFETIVRLNKERELGIFLIEQNASLALEIAHHGYVLENGRIALEGPAAELAANPDVRSFYLGFQQDGERRRHSEQHLMRRRARWDR